MTTANSPGEEYYRQNYRSYDQQNPDYKLAYYRGRLEQYRDRSLPKRIHDIGCGPGRFLAGLQDGWEVFGSDINTYAIDRARRQMPAGHFALGSGAVDVLFDEPFSVVTAFDVLEHVPDIEAAGQNIATQLSQGGLFVFVVPVYDGLSGPIIRRLDRDPTHVHKRPRQFWIDWASRYFEILAWEGVVRYLLPGGLYLHLVSSRFRHHTPAVMIACRSRDDGAGRR